MRLLSKVIKASQYNQIFSGIAENGSTDGGLACVPGADVNTQKKQVLDKAFQKAKKIVDSAQKYSANQLREAAEKIKIETADNKQRGYDDGFAQGLEEGKKAGTEIGERMGRDEGLKKSSAENRKSLEELSTMIESVEKAKTRVLQEFESDLEELALTIARAILKKELEIDDKSMRTIIQNATDSYRNQSWLRIYVSDNTANVLLKADNNIVEILKSVSENVKVISAPGMNDGGCVLEMPDQVIDAGVDTQLKKMKSAIENAINSETV